jgi:tetratricopeptide (TPR) repeat protein
MDEASAKQTARELINRWIKRARIQKKDLATRAGFLTYDEFYGGYLSQSRSLNTDPAAAIGVVRAFVEGLPAARRCTADEAISFLIATRLPLDRYPEALQPFPLAERRAAFERHLAVDLPAATGDIDAAALLAEINALVRQRPAAAPPAPDLLATMPLDDGTPLPSPAAMPLPHRMPLARGRLFGGRDDELRALARLVHSQEIGGATAITGIGGMGKTSLASEFAHRYGQFFAGGVFWVSSAEPATIALELATCGESGLVHRDDWGDLTLDERARLVQAAWQEPVPRLLIFDSCEDVDAFMRWRPTSGGCRVVITSRRTRWSRSIGVETLALGELSPVAGLALLRRYRPDLQADNPGLTAITTELAGLPLALHLAGSYLETYQDDRVLGDPARFLRDLRADGPLDHLALRGVDVAPSVTAHTLHVGRTFAISLNRLDPRDPHDALARAMLGRAAWLAPGEPCAIDLLAEAARGADSPAHGAARRLGDLGLLPPEIGLVRIHRLVAEYARVGLGHPPARADLVRTLAERATRAYDSRDPAEARMLLPHMLPLAAAPAENDVQIPLWNSLPFALDLVGDVRGGVAYLAQAHVALLRDEMIETPLGATVLNNLAEWLRAVGEAEQARPLYDQALAIRLAILPADDLDIAESYGNLGELLREQGDFPAARAHYERALEIALRSGGPRHDKTLAFRNNLALLLYNQQHYAEAVAQFAPLLAATEEAFGPGDPRVAAVRMNMATALFRQGDAAAGTAQISQAVASLQAALGDEHPDTLRARLNAARGLVMIGETGRAAVELRALIAPLTAAFGGDSPLSRLARDTLAQVEKEG